MFFNFPFPVLELLILPLLLLLLLALLLPPRDRLPEVGTRGRLADAMGVWGAA